MSGQQYEPGKVPAKLDLPAGSYLLKTYNLAYKDMPNWVDTETVGAAFMLKRIYRRCKINYLNVEVPMVLICKPLNSWKVLVIALRIIIYRTPETDP